MSITPTAADPFGLGTDIRLLGGLNPVWGLVSSFENLGCALARRFNAVLGSLFYSLGYGFDISDLVNQALVPSDISRISQALAGQALLDERVGTCRAALSLVPQTGELTIAVTGTTAVGGAPFRFILAATDVTVTLLSVNGNPFSATAAAPSATFTGPTTVIIGGGGSSEPGPAGPPGPSGSASESVPILDVESALGTEDPQPQTQKEVNWGALPATVTITLNAMISSAAGSAVFKVRINGSDNVADGTVVATLTASSPSATATSGGSTIANPGGLGRLIVTAQSNGTNDCQMRNATLTIR